jgi:hypothetical protein
MRASGRRLRTLVETSAPNKGGVVCAIVTPSLVLLECVQRTGSKRLLEAESTQEVTEALPDHGYSPPDLCERRLIRVRVRAKPTATYCEGDAQPATHGAVRRSVGAT